MDLRTLEITSENLGEVLKGLIAGVADLEGAEAKLKLDLRNMVELMAKYPHNDDAYHNGETVLVHVGWVLEDVERLSAGMDDERRVALRLAGLFHDLGKAYTYEFNAAKQKHTFYDHATKSVEIAEVLLARHREALGGLYQRVLDLTRLHDVFFALAAERPKGGNSTAYVERLMKEKLYLDGHLDDLLTFAKADSARARSYAEKLSDIEGIIEDAKKHEAILAAKVAERARLDANAKARMPEIRSLVEAEVPAAAGADDVKGVRAELGKAKRYDLIKQVDAIVIRP